MHEHTETNPFNAAPTNTVFVENVERVLIPEGPVTGDVADKVHWTYHRGIWRGADVVVLPFEPEPSFVQYAASHGVDPEIIVPVGVANDSVSIGDALKAHEQPALQQVIGGSIVDSYVAEALVSSFVRQHDGTYHWDDVLQPRNGTHDGLIGNTILEVIGDKQNVAALTEGIITVPEGVTVSGLEAIAEAVQQRLDQDGQAFVRHTRSGGGFGNAYFQAEDKVLSPGRIIDRLRTENSHLWDDTATARVEAYAPPQYSPAITMDEGRMAYHSLQITRDGDFVGTISPTPGSILPNHRAQQLADGIASRLDRLPYRHKIGVDLGYGNDGWCAYEFNGRNIGSMHAIDIAEHFTAPWDEWQQQGITTKAVDSFHFAQPLSFDELHGRLTDSHVALASREQPFGVVITIPPLQRGEDQLCIGGIQVIARNYQDIEQRFNQVQELIGHPTRNYYDDTSVGTRIFE